MPKKSLLKRRLKASIPEKNAITPEPSSGQDAFSSQLGGTSNSLGGEGTTELPLEEPVANIPVEEDNRPDTSPYTSSLFTLYIGSRRVAYYIPKELLRQSPIWSSIHHGFSTGHMSLPQVNEDVGHVLVHYLYTGRYQTLKPEALSKDAKDAIELKRSILAYRTAATYGLADLETLAKSELDVIEQRMASTDVISVAIRAYLEYLEDEIWFCGYLKSHIKSAFEEDETLLIKDSFLDCFAGNAILNKILVKAVVEIYTNKIKGMVGKEWGVESPVLEKERARSDIHEEFSQEQPECETPVSSPSISEICHRDTPGEVSQAITPPPESVCEDCLQEPTESQEHIDLSVATAFHPEFDTVKLRTPPAPSECLCPNGSDSCSSGWWAVNSPKVANEMVDHKTQLIFPRFSMPGTTPELKTEEFAPTDSATEIFSETEQGDLTVPKASSEIHAERQEPESAFALTNENSPDCSSAPDPQVGANDNFCKYRPKHLKEERWKRCRNCQDYLCRVALQHLPIEHEGIPT